MANSVHLFFCGSGFKGAGLFALTNDRSGATCRRRIARRVGDLQRVRK